MLAFSSYSNGLVCYVSFLYPMLRNRWWIVPNFTSRCQTVGWTIHLSLMETKPLQNTQPARALLDLRIFCCFLMVCLLILAPATRYLITTALQNILKSGRANPLSFFFFAIVLLIFMYLFFQLKVIIKLSRNQKNNKTKKQHSRFWCEWHRVYKMIWGKLTSLQSLVIPPRKAVSC